MARDLRRAPRAVNIALIVLIVVLAAAAAWSWRLRSAAQDQAADDRSAVRAASTYALFAMSQDHRTIDTTLDRLAGVSTGEARQRNEAEQAEIKKAVTRDKVRQTGVLRAAGLASMSADRGTAEVLVAADAVISWEDGAHRPENRYYRWRLRLTHSSGVWLVEHAELVP